MYIENDEKSLYRVKKLKENNNTNIHTYMDICILV